ncbi:MAG: type III ribulose-bisphosphate carboxylase [Candidatus Pacearchaeota archaeon]
MYDEYLNLKYTPKDDIVCLFRIEPANNLTIKEAAERVAAESSVGTWTEIPKFNYVKDLRAKVFSIKGEYVKIAYPSELFEKGNMANILSSVAGNIFGMKDVKALRLEDIQFPKSIIKSFYGPLYGLKGIRKILRIKKRPLVGTIVKPKLGLKTEEHAKSAYESWLGGCDFVKDDENLSSQDFNKFEKRLLKTLEMKDKAEKETGEKKAYLINVTAETEEMIRRAELVKKQNAKFIMVDMLTVGFSALQTLSKENRNLKLVIHGHRAMHAALTRNEKHGVSMMVLADIARLIGLDSLHIGTGIGKMETSIKEVHEIEEEIEENYVKETKTRLQQNWYKIKPMLAVCSGGLHPGHVPFLIKHLGDNILIQAGGGIHGHPYGSIAGAKAMRQAVDACMKKISLANYSKNHYELREALRRWASDELK